MHENILSSSVERVKENLVACSVVLPHHCFTESIKIVSCDIDRVDELTNENDGSLFM